MFRNISASVFRPTRRRPAARTIPRLEGPEDRRLLATFNPLTSAADGGPNPFRFAVIAADENLQDSTIDLQSGTYQLTTANPAGQENGAAQGDLDLTPTGHTLIMQGQEAGSTIIDGAGLDRVFQVAANVNVFLTVRHGVAWDAGVAGASPGTQAALGGGILPGCWVLPNGASDHCWRT